ncbi:hypothetical protein HD554DRAFT_2172561 [Boletus coccyginus]|nr:hypothetical protein HD554DRAFT_2172561 [Boletus coccyginus]
MSNIEMVHIHADRGSDHRSSEPPPATSDHRPGSSQGEDGSGEGGSGEDVETPASSASLLPPLKGYQGGRGSSLISIWQWALVFCFPVISIAYLIFCYVVHYQVVPAGFSADTTAQFLTNLGAGITSINIIIISLALFPLKTILCDLQSEEFFRLLSAQKNSYGVELTAVNGISNPSYGFIESIKVVVNRHCSFHYVMALVATLAVFAVSILAPAALSIQSVLIDGPVMAFSVGTIPPLSLYQPATGGQVVPPLSFSPRPGYAAAVVWAEREIGLSYSFSILNDSQGVYSGFVVPTPPMLNSEMSARWLTDVVGFNPYCTWANPVNLTATSFNFTMNSTQVPSTALSVHLENLNLRVSVPSSYFPVYNSFFVTSINVHDPTVTVLNYTTGNLPTDGATVISVIQCASSSCTEEVINFIPLFVDFTDVPSMGFSSIGADYELGFLVCKPNITIETREIRTGGSVTLEVQPVTDDTPPYPRQGNLDWTQTSLLVAYSLSALTTESGPESSAYRGLGSETQADFIFGRDQLDTIPTSAEYDNTSMVLKPLSPDLLAQGYTEIVKAAMKPYVSGSLGTSYVPGRVASGQRIFVSSLPHVVASTILVIVLLVMAVAAHFRPGRGYQFNLTNVAAALADSEVPQIVKKAKVDVVANVKPSASRHWWLGNNVGQEPRRMD